MLDPRVDLEFLFSGCHIYLEQLDCHMRGCLWEGGRCKELTSISTDPPISTAGESAGTEGEEGGNVFIQIRKSWILEFLFMSACLM